MDVKGVHTMPEFLVLVAYVQMVMKKLLLVNLLVMVYLKYYKIFNFFLKYF